jgi:hypothetical protein
MAAAADAAAAWMLASLRLFALRFGLNSLYVDN